MSQNACLKYNLQAYGLEHFIFDLVFIPDQRQRRYKRSKLITKKDIKNEKIKQITLYECTYMYFNAIEWLALKDALKKATDSVTRF